MAEIRYDIKRGTDIYRQIYISRLQRWIFTGKIKLGDVLVWRSGLSGWRKPEELDELAPFFKKWEKYQLRRVKKKRIKSQIPHHGRQIKKILIIDDEKDLCLLLSEVLSSKKYNVAIANTKKEAVRCIKREPPDLVFLDLKLPDGDGIKLLPKIKKIRPETIVNIISAYGSEESREEAKKKGAYAFIDKPFTERQILRSIERVS
ncbi:response regulator [Patescibacteria group bacterium]|nr:response regulator [bacterium]MBU0999650.1 response regulator [Patescibacteria group bacterium]